MARFTLLDDSLPSPGRFTVIEEPKEPTVADTVADVGEQAVRGFNRGLVGLVTAPYRAIDWAGEKITGKDFLPNVEELSLYKPFLDQPEAKTTAGRYAGAAGEAVGASALPSAGLISQGQRLAALAPTTTARAIGQSIGRQVAANPRAALAADIVSATGAGVGQQAAEDMDFGPAGQVVGGLIGGAAPLAVSGTIGSGVRATQRARARSSPYGRIVSQLGDQTVDDLAQGVATGTTRGDAFLNRRVLDYLGQEMVNARGNRQQAVQNTIDRLVQDGVSPTAARDQVRRVLNVHRDSELFFGEYPAVATSNQQTRLARNLANVTDEAAGGIEDSGVHWLTDTIASASAGASSSRVRNAIMSRLPALREQLRGRLLRMSPNQQTIQDADNLLANLARQAQREYDAVYNAPGGTAVNYRILHGLLPRIAERHLNRMRGRSGEQADALRAAINELYTELPNGQRVIMPSLQMLQDMRGAIRGMIQRNRQTGNDHIVNTLQPLYRDITRVMERASPLWARANRRWADLRIGEVARDLGESFAEKAGPRFREQMRQFQQLAPEAQDLVRIEFVQKLLDKVDNVGDTHDLAKLFSTPHMRSMVRTLLGDQAAVDLARLIRDNRVATKSKNMLGGSPTQPRQQRQKEQDADLGILAAVEQASVNNFRKFLVDYTIGILREARNRRIADVITTPMRDVPQVARHLEQMRRAQSRLNQLSQPRTPLSQRALPSRFFSQVPALEEE